MRGRWLAIAAVALALVGLAAFVAERPERTLRIDVRCMEDGCRLSADGGPALWWDAPRAARGTRVGLYAYQPFEFPGRPLFRGLSVEPEGGVASTYALLDADGTPAEWREADAWRVRPGAGFGPRLAPGERSSVLLAGTFRNFSLRAEVVDPSDVGIVLGAQDAGSGAVFAVRPHHNDVLLFEVAEGRAGETLALEPLRELTFAREALRLAGLTARVVLPGLLLALALGAWRARRRRGSVASSSPPSVAEAAAEPATGGKSRRAGAVVALLALVAFGAHVTIALYGLGGVPHIADESAYLFQARLFAAGEPWVAPPGLPDFFRHEHVVMTAERWFAKYPPLVPALLGMGLIVGAPWLVNPLLGALLVVAVFLLAREFCDVRWALLAAFLAVTSPFLLVMNATLMAHTATGLLVTVALWLTLRAVRRRALLEAAFAGASLGAAALARPYTAFLVALAIGGWLAIAWARAQDRRAIAAVAVTLVACALPFGAAYRGWSAAYTEDGAGHVYATYAPSDTLGFGAGKGSGWLKTWGSWGHTPAKALRSIHQYLDYFSRDLLGWPGRVALALLVAGLVLGRFRSFPPTWLLLGTFGVLVVGHTLYWATQHILFGARYWFEAAPALIVLITLSLRSINLGEARGIPGARINLGGGLVAGLVLAGLVGYLPGRLAELPRYGGIGAELKREVAQQGLTDAVIFVQTQGLQYNDGFHMNDPLTWDYPIFARDLGPRNAELLRRHPGHPAYRWDGERLARLPDPAVLHDLSRAEPGR